MEKGQLNIPCSVMPGGEMQQAVPGGQQNSRNVPQRGEGHHVPARYGQYRLRPGRGLFYPLDPAGRDIKGGVTMAETGQNPDKVYVDVTVRFNRDGVVSPVSFIWEDVAAYDIDRVVNVRRAASTRAGGTGIMFTCIVDGRKSHLFYEENNRWFMERKHC